MAVTGSGTQANPFIVHSYDEIKNWGDYTGQRDGTWYFKLANDIDCNDYGDTWEWETIQHIGWVINAYKSLDLDLNGHTIKNIMIKSGHCLFKRESEGTSSDTRCGTSKIHNGKILNIFNNGADCIFWGSNTPKNNGFENVSLSINGNNFKEEVFYNCFLNKCSVYFVRNTPYNQQIFNYYNVSEPVIKNCDFYIEYPKATAPMAENSDSGVTLFSDCRFRGKIALNGYSFGAPIKCGIRNCVVDMNVTDTGLAWAGFVSSGTGVINSSKLDHIGTGGLTAVTDAELKSAAALQAKGFNVVKVG